MDHSVVFVVLCFVLRDWLSGRNEDRVGLGVTSVSFANSVVPLMPCAGYRTSGNSGALLACSQPLAGPSDAPFQRLDPP